MLTNEDKKTITQIFQEGLHPVHQRLDSMEKRLQKVEKKVDGMDKKLDLTISYFDQVTTDHTKRIKRVEHHLNLPPLAA